MRFRLSIFAGSAAAVALACGLALSAAADSTPTAPAAAQAPSLELLRHALDPNPTLRSYTATATLETVLELVIPLHQRFTGKVYYLRPKRTIIFDDLPPALSAFRTLSTNTPTFEQTLAEYSVAPNADDGVISTFVLTPKSSDSRVKTLTLTVDDRNGLLRRSRYEYVDGSSLGFDEEDGDVGGFQLPARDAIAARFPAYTLDGTLRLADYRPNAHVDPSVFSETPAR